METGEYLKAIYRRWPVVAAVVGLAVVLGWLSAPSSAPKPHYKATAVIAVRLGTGATVALDPSSPEIVATQATSKEVAARAKASLKFKGSPESLAAQVQATFNPKGSVKISSTQSDAAMAVKVTNAFAHELVSYLQQQQDQQVGAAVNAANKSLSDLQDRSDSLDKQLVGTTDPLQQAKLKGQKTTVAREMSLALARLQQLDAVRGPGTSRATLVTEASAVPTTAGLAPPSSPPVRAAIAAIVGLLLGVGLAIFLDRLDPTLRTKRQVEAAFGLPVLAEVPLERRAQNRVHVAAEPKSAIAEAYRTLRTATLFMPLADNGRSPPTQNGSSVGGQAPEQDGRPVASTPTGSDPGVGSEGRLIVVTSPGEGDGKTASAVNLAAAFAEAGKSALVVGADLRRPAAAGYLGLSETPGITDVLNRAPGTPPPRVVHQTSIPGLSVLPSGSAVDNPAGMLTRGRDLIVKCRSLADVVIVDTPPLLVANDAVELILAADAVIVVCRCGLTTAESARSAAELLHRLKAPVVGVAVVGLTNTPRSSARTRRRSRRHRDGDVPPSTSPMTDPEVDSAAPTHESASTGPLDESPTPTP